MKGIDDILLLGDPLLYEISQPVLPSELSFVPGWIGDLHHAMEEIRARYHFGRAIAAPQLGIMKRLIYMNIHEPKVLINPRFSSLSDEMMEVWDDCMSFPNLLVKVMRHRRATLHYLDEHWQEHTWELQDDLSELLQHEVDHLDGILSPMRAIDDRSFKWER